MDHDRSIGGFLESLAQNERMRDAAFTRTWYTGAEAVVHRVATTVNHADTDQINAMMRVSDVSIPEAVATYIATTDALCLDKDMQEQYPDVPSDFLARWYGHASAVLLYSLPTIANTDVVSVDIDGRILPPFDTASKFADDDNGAVKQKVIQLMEYDPWGEQAMRYIAHDPFLLAKRAGVEDHPDKVQAAIAFGVMRFESLIRRVKQEFPTQYNPDTSAIVIGPRIYKQDEEHVVAIWSEEVKKVIEQYPIVDEDIEIAKVEIAGGRHPYTVILDFLEDEIADVINYCEEHVARGFPAKDLREPFLAPSILLAKTIEEVEPNRYDQQHAQEIEITPEGVLVQKVDSTTRALLTQAQQRTQQDVSGFDALAFITSDPTLTEKHIKNPQFHQMNSELMTLGAMMHKRLYLSLAQEGIVPFPDQDSLDNNIL